MCDEECTAAQYTLLMLDRQISPIPASHLPVRSLYARIFVSAPKHEHTCPLMRGLPNVNFQPITPWNIVAKNPFVMHVWVHGHGHQSCLSGVFLCGDVEPERPPDLRSPSNHQTFHPTACIPPHTPPSEPCAWSVYEKSRSFTAVVASPQGAVGFRPTGSTELRLLRLAAPLCA